MHYLFMNNVRILIPPQWLQLYAKTKTIELK